MAQDAENAQSRLQNIEAVLPILGALRTISLGSWQSALKRRAGLADYTQGMLSMLPAILRELSQSRRPVLFPRRHASRKPSTTNTGIVYALGTERGLCGGYNRVLAEQIVRHCRETLVDETYDLTVVGGRLMRALASLAEAPAIAVKKPSSLTGMPTYSDAANLAGSWLRTYESGELDFVDIIYNANVGTGQYIPKVLRVIPPDMDTVIHANEPKLTDNDGGTIIDSDPLSLLVHIIEQYTSITLYQIMLEATATEHAARYQLMEAADKNATGLIEELTMSIQSLRRQAITREMQELAVGSGLLR